MVGRGLAHPLTVIVVEKVPHNGKASSSLVEQVDALLNHVRATAGKCFGDSAATFMKIEMDI